MPDPFAAALEDLVDGAELETRGRTITETDLVSFAALSGDWHPQHSDVSWASESVFGERIAHGMLVASYAIGLLPIDPGRVVALRGVDDLVFKRAVRVEDTIRASARIGSHRALDDATGLVKIAVKVRNQRDELVARFCLNAIWRRSNAAAAPADEDHPAPVEQGTVLV